MSSTAVPPSSCCSTSGQRGLDQHHDARQRGLDEQHVDQRRVVGDDHPRRGRQRGAIDLGDSVVHEPERGHEPDRESVAPHHEFVDRLALLDWAELADPPAQDRQQDERDDRGAAVEQHEREPGQGDAEESRQGEARGDDHSFTPRCAGQAAAALTPLHDRAWRPGAVVGRCTGVERWRSNMFP
jgi:hypothetical protein